MDDLLRAVCDDLLLLVASHWISQGEFLKMMDHNEEGKNTEGQYNDQDLYHYEQEVEQIHDDELHSSKGRAERGSRKWTV